MLSMKIKVLNRKNEEIPGGIGVFGDVELEGRVEELVRENVRDALLHGHDHRRRRRGKPLNCN